MTDCKPTPEFENLVRKMARNRYANGVMDRKQVVDAIHSAIGDATPAWKNEIADIVHAEIGEHLTLAEAQARLLSTRNEIRKLASTQQNATRRAQLERDMVELKRRIDTGDVSKKPRVRLQYSKEVMEAIADRERLRMQADDYVRKMSESRRTTAYRAMKRTADVMRSGILTSPVVFVKLLMASAWRLGSTILEDMAGAGLNMIPAYRRIADMAPVEGGGFNAAAHEKGFGGMFSRETWKAIKDKLRKGASDRQAVYGEGHVTSNALDTALAMPGRSHDAIKTPLEQYAYYRAAEREDSNMRRALRAAGKTPEEIDHVMSTDSIVAAINARAFAESKAAKLQGDNKVVDAYNNMLASAEKSGDVGAFAAMLFRFETPIVRIPANYAAEIGSYVGGGIKAASRNKAAKLKGGLTPDDADYIIRNLKKQTVGAGALILGWEYYQHFGGMYRPMKKDPNKDVPVGDAEVGGVKISHDLLHSPFVGVMQAAALAHYVFDEDLRKSHDGSYPGLAKAFGTGAATGIFAVVQSIPLFDVAKDVDLIVRGGFGRFAGQKAAQLAIPGAVQWYARHEDVDSQGERVRRSPKDFTDEIKQAIPGYREEVPRAKR